MNNFKGVLLIVLLLSYTASFLYSEEEVTIEDEIISITDERKSILHFGIDAEIIPLLESIINERDTELLDHIARLFKESSNPSVKLKCLEYFKVLAVDNGLEYAIKLLDDRENQTEKLIIAVMDYLLPLKPYAVSAIGMRHIAKQPEKIAYLTLLFKNKIMAHVNVNWLAHVKVR